MKVTIELDTQQDDDAALLDNILRALAVKDEPPSTEEPSDPTRRVLPIPPGLPPLPPVPEGYDRWVGRGTFIGQTIFGAGRFLCYWAEESKRWFRCSNFSCNIFHIEAIKEGDQ